MNPMQMVTRSNGGSCPERYSVIKNPTLLAKASAFAADPTIEAAIG